MYIESLRMTDFKSFKKETLSFFFPSQGKERTPFDNVTLLLGQNASGKTSILRAICLAVLAKVLPSSGFVPRFLVRENSQANIERCKLEASLVLGNGDSVLFSTAIDRDQGLVQQSPKNHREIFDEKSLEFFLVAYGASRWIPIPGPNDFPSQRSQNRKVRYQRVASLFEDHFGLMPLEAAFANLANIPRMAELLNALVEPLGFETAIIMEPFVGFKKNGIKLPLWALSDGYRSYISWIGDFLFHLEQVCPKGMALEEMKGVVLIDEVDLHLHASWQRTIIETISRIFYNIQFIVTSHSPLVAGAIPSNRILHVQSDEDGASTAKILDQKIYGLDSDQVLLSDYFGLNTTRAVAFEAKVHDLCLY